MSRGYSLMELVVVLAILAVGAALVGPAVGRTVDDVRARAEAAAVAAFLRSAREQAITRQQAVEVTVDRDAHALLLRRAGREVPAAPPTRLASHAALRAEGGAIPTGVAFLPHGTSSGGRFMVRAPGAREYTITVDALTGRVTTGRAAR